MDKRWFEVKNVANAPVELWLYSDIGEYGVTAADFVAELSAIKGPINLHINSNGGDVFQALAIYTALKARAPTVYIDGLAASAASLVAMAGNKIIMAKHSWLMAHAASGLTVGFAADHRKMADLLDLMSKNIASIYSERAGGSVEDWLALMNEETWFSDEQAVAAGLADEVAGDAVNATVDLSKFKNPPAIEPAPEPEPDVADADEPEPVEVPGIDYAALFREATEGVL